MRNWVPLTKQDELNHDNSTLRRDNDTLRHELDVLHGQQEFFSTQRQKSVRLLAGRSTVYTSRSVLGFLFALLCSFVCRPCLMLLPWLRN